MAGCIEFDRVTDSEYVEVANYFSPNNTEGTIAAWVYFNAVNVSGNTIWHNNGGQYQIRLNSTGNLESAVLGTAGGKMTGSTSLSASTWYHVAITWNSSGNAEMFLNFSSEATASGTRVTNTGEHRIGGLSLAANNLDGKLAHVQHWNRVLSIAELRKAAADPGSIADGLQLHLTMQDGAANTQIDRSGNGRDGTVNATPNDLNDGPPTLP